MTIRDLLHEWEEARRCGTDRDKDKRNPLLTLASTCKRLDQLASFLLYRDITITDERKLERLATCLKNGGGDRLGLYTESLALDLAMRRWMDPYLLVEAAEVLAGCANLHALALSEDFLPILSSSASSKHPRPVEITLLNLPVKGLPFADGTPRYHPELFTNLTHLTLAEPPELWFDPLMALLSLPMAPRTLKHLTLSRKEHSNTDNDAAFFFCISTVLQMADVIIDDDSDSDDSSMGIAHRSETRFSKLERVTIRIFPGYGGAKHDEDADIWISARILASKNSRVSVEKGYWGTWVKTWGCGRGL